MLIEKVYYQFNKLKFQAPKNIRISYFVFRIFDRKIGFSVKHYRGVKNETGSEMGSDY